MTARIALLYHRVAALDCDPWRLAVTPAHFAEHLELVARTCRCVALAELIEGPDDDDPLPRVAITFDDGYVDLLATAQPLLQRFDLPATLFLPTGLLGSERGFWWDDLARVVLEARSLRTRSTSTSALRARISSGGSMRRETPWSKPPTASQESLGKAPLRPAAPLPSSLGGAAAARARAAAERARRVARVGRSGRRRCERRSMFERGGGASSTTGWANRSWRPHRPSSAALVSLPIGAAARDRTGAR